MPVGIGNGLGTSKGSACRGSKLNIAIGSEDHRSLARRAAHLEHLTLTALYTHRNGEGMSRTLRIKVNGFLLCQLHTLGGNTFGHSLLCLEGIKERGNHRAEELEMTLGILVVSI